ncbi:hypothetical protein [Candidatus Solincola tengchongensis]|uniref:hypothetical protein n=1 Tax=Candidatus Solincola tengchongensis TaxID=2900693 RepID=UPI00257F3EBF|nr:hypothetical protein [Candidatus Solincola tengchongensis]
MSEKQFGAARWLTALAVIFIPLSIIILISGSWLANFTSNQWTRYLLFASWVFMTLSTVLGVANMVSGAGEESSPLPDVAGDAGIGEEEGRESEPLLSSRAEPKGQEVEQSLLLGQVSCFLLGLFLYVAFISWMVLPKIGLSGL